MQSEIVILFSLEMQSADDRSVSFLDSDVINDDFFIDIVERKLSIKRDEFKLRLIDIEPATGKNENHASVMYRGKINIELLASGKRQFVNVIIKALLNGMDILEDTSVFLREILIYGSVIKHLESIYKEKTKEIVTFAPKCLKLILKLQDVIVLDDLKAEGFVMLDRKVGVDFNQAKLAMKKFAKFHAASAVLYQKVSY
jgi:hypothetical protein